MSQFFQLLKTINYFLSFYSSSILQGNPLIISSCLIGMGFIIFQQRLMDRRSLFSFDVMSSRSNRITKEIEIPLLKNRSQERKPQNLFQNQMRCIVDRSNTPKNSNPTLYERLCSFLQGNISVINPQSDYLLMWNILNLLAIFYNFLQIPIIILVASVSEAVIDQSVQNGLDTMDYICLLTFFFDLMVVRYRIAYYQNEVLVANIQNILTRYIKTGLLIDVITFFAYFFDFLYGGVGIYFKIIFYLKLYTFRSIDIQVQSKAMYNRYANAFYRFIKMVGLIFFLTSFQACIYFSIDYHYYMDGGENFHNNFLWLTASESCGYENLMTMFNWPAWYVFALYWAVQTTSAVGYGNNTPRNPTEILLCNIVMLTTICIFVSFANTILDIVDELQENTLERQAKIIQFSNFTNTNETQRKTRQKVKLYFNCLIQSKYDDSQEHILSLLPNILQERFHLNFKLYIFNNLQILNILTKNNNQWNNFALGLTHILKMRYYSRDDFIQFEGKKNDFKLYVIQRGKVTAYNDLISYKKDYRVWEYFGQKQFFFEGMLLNNIICRSFTKVYYFQSIQFFNSLRQYPQLYQRCLQKMDEVRLNNRTAKDFGVTCPNCDEDHLLQICPIAVLWKDRLPRVKKIKDVFLNQRKAYERKHRVFEHKLRLRSRQAITVDVAYHFKAYFTYRNL